MATAKEILSQDEIDALLGGVDEGEVETAGPGEEIDTSSAEVRPYDLASQDRVIRGRMPGLDNINERFCRLTRSSLFNLLNQTVEVGVGGTQVLKYQEYIHTLYLPTSVNLIRLDPLRGTAMMVLDAKLIFRFVDQFFGGTGRHARIEGREFTPTEARVIRLILKHLFQDLQEAWQKIEPVAVQYLGTEVNPSLANACNPSDVVLVNSFHVEVAGGGGEIHVALPFTMLEPIRRKLETAGRGDDENQQPHWTRHLEAHVRAAEVPVGVTVAEATLSLRDVLAMQAGDVLPIDKPALHVARADGVPVFTGTLGVSGNQLALQVEAFARGTAAAGPAADNESTEAQDAAVEDALDE